MSARRTKAAEQPRQYDAAVVAIIDRLFLDLRGAPVCDRSADEALERIVSTALRLRLAARRADGLSGWHVKKGVSHKLFTELRNAAANGAMLDVIVCAAKIHARAHLYGPEA